MGGAIETEGAIAGTWLEGGKEKPCSEEVATPNWQEVLGAQSSSI